MCERKAEPLLDDCSFGAPCSCEHHPGGEADSQVVLLQAQQLGTVLHRLTRLVPDGAAACKTRRRADMREATCSLYSTSCFYMYSYLIPNKPVKLDHCYI